MPIPGAQFPGLEERLIQAGLDKKRARLAQATRPPPPTNGISNGFNGLGGSSPLIAQTVSHPGALAHPVPAVPPPTNGGGGFLGGVADFFTDPFTGLVGDFQEAFREDIADLGDILGGVLDVVGGVATVDPQRSIGGFVDIATAPFTQQTAEQGDISVMPHPGQAIGGVPAVGGGLPQLGQIVRVWDTAPGHGVTGGGRVPIFVKLANGQIHVRRMDGVWKRVKKSRNIVIPSNPRLGSFIRAEKRIASLTKRIAKATKRLKNA